MKFFRVNDTTIKCMIPVSDLAERGITPEDIVGQKKEALQFLHDVIMMGAREVGISETEQFTTLQLAIINQNMLVMLASKGDCRKEVEDFWKELNAQLTPRLPAPNKAAPRPGLVPQGAGLVFSVDSLYDAVKLAELLPLGAGSMLSSLYKDPVKGGFYLVLEPSAGWGGAFPALFCLTSEFGQLKVTEAAGLSFLKEQLVPILKENALSSLRGTSEGNAVPSPQHMPEPEAASLPQNASAKSTGSEDA